MAKRTIVILGGALSGPTAAARARELDESARIILVERNTDVSYAVCGLAYHLSGEVGSIGDLNRERKGFFEPVYRIEVWTGSEAIALDPAARVVSVRRGARIERLKYDALVFALGAASPIPSVPGLSGKNVRAFRTLQDLAALKAALSQGKRRVAIIGGGPMGVEAADGLVRGGAKVTLIEKEDRLLPQFGIQPSRAAERALGAKARLLLGTTVTSAQGASGKVRTLRLSSGLTLEVDAVVVAAGLAPRTELLAAAGARLAPDGSVQVNDRAETSLAGVFACGVCISVPSAVTGQPLWSPQGALADKSAQVAGANATGADVRLAPAEGTMLIRVLKTVVGRTGLSAAEARTRLGAEAEVTTIHAPSHDPFFPGAEDVLVELVWDRLSGRILGIESAGRAGVDKRVDVAAAAIAGGLSVEALAATDLAYAPPFSSARDPINVAASVASAHRRGLIQSLDPAAVQERLASLQLLDVRRPAEVRAGTLAGALGLPLEQLREKLARLDPKRPVVVFCDTGRRGSLAARVLKQRGFEQVFNLAGGLRSWQLCGYPLGKAKR